MVQSYSLPVSEAASPTLSAADGQTNGSGLKSPPTPYVPRHKAYGQQQQHNQSSLSEKDRLTVGASSRVTESLRQMHASLQSELERSEYANETMRESTKSFQQLHESYSSLEVMLTNSRDLVGTLLRSQKSDTWYLQTSFYMLAVVGSWLVFRRLLYGPTWWLFYQPFRFLVLPVLGPLFRILFGAGSQGGDAALESRGETGGSGRVEVGGIGGKVPVEGLPKDDLPTANVGQGEGSAGGDDPDSMVDQIGKIVDEGSANEGVVVDKGAGSHKDEL